MFTLQNQVLLQLSQICNVAASAISSPAAAGFRSTTSRSSRAFIPQTGQQTIVGNSTTTSSIHGEEKIQNGPTTTTTSTKTPVEKVNSSSVSGGGNGSGHGHGGKNELIESLQVTKMFLKSNGLKELSKTEESFISILASKIFQNSLKPTSSSTTSTTTTATIASTTTTNALDRCLDILKQLNVPELQSQACHVVQKNFGTSYKSSGSFDMDKCMGSILSSPSTRSNNLLAFNRISKYAVPYRTFKTDRDIRAEAERNPSILSRLKLKLFPARIDLNQNQVAGGGAAVTGTEKSEKLKNILSDSPPAEASRLKIAFAEGYVAANPTTEGKSRTYRWLRTLQQVLAIAVFTAILASLMGSFGGSIFRINNANGNEVQPEDITVTFHDVKGVDEAKAELQEVVEFLRNPEKFVQLGGKLPKGVLLVGPPGTGKTLLARAVAGEAGVPYFHAAGPEFDEILVGQGARRVRDLFKAAKAKAPCVIFIDEIDSVGAKRTNSVLHPYANQTINQLLSEMDGFRQNEGVIVLGATNRREDLDKALLRPGRFDVEVTVAPPEYQGRKEILEHYLSKVKQGTDIDVDTLARGTTGFTGADIENVVNQAALRAAIEGAASVGKKHLDFARDKVIMGPERKTRIPDEETNRITAYHEGGHAIVAHFTKDSNPLHKVTIIPRGVSLGHTAYIPEKEQYHVTRSQLMAMMDTMMGGRAAEELIFGNEKITSGASSDLKQASSIASHMVKEWGMSDKVGLRTVDDSRGSFVTVNELGPQTSELIDREINRLLQESYERAKTILKVHSKEHKALAEALMKYETLDAEDVKAILAGNTTKHVYPKTLAQTLKEKNEKTAGTPVGTATPPLSPEALAPTKKLIN